MQNFYHSVLRATLLAGVSLSITATASAQATADNAATADQPGDAIVVTGIRASLADERDEEAE